jgi:uncharacterized protein (TIGR03437 family)
MLYLPLFTPRNWFGRFLNTHSILTRCFAAVLLSVGTAAAQQVIAVQNAASGSAGLPPKNVIAPGSIMEIQQTRAPLTLLGARDVSVQVKPLGTPEPLNATLFSSPPFSVWAELPASTPLGPADVTLVVDGLASAPARIAVVRTNFGLFTQGSGLGAAIAQNQDSGAAPVLNNLTHPVLPGQYVILWGTGLGSAQPDEVKVRLGGIDVAPAYAGPAPGLPGVDQINVQVPASGIPDGCYVSVLVKAAGGQSNEATIAKANQPGVCSHPFGLSAADLATLDSGDAILFGSIGLQSELGPAPADASGGNVRLDTAGVNFFLRDAFGIGLLAQHLVNEQDYFACNLAPVPGLFSLLAASIFDAGPSLTLIGPGQTATLQGVGGGYFYSGPPLFVPGRWRIQGPGGRTIGPFEAELLLPPLPRWTNRDKLATLSRNADQDVTWDTGGYTDAEVATVAVAQTRLAAILAPLPEIICRARATDGKLTLPAGLLAMFPPDTQVSARLTIETRPERRTLFAFPLTDGSSAKSLFGYSFSETLITAIR